MRRQKRDEHVRRVTELSSSRPPNLILVGILLILTILSLLSTRHTSCLTRYLDASRPTHESTALPRTRLKPCRRSDYVPEEKEFHVYKSQQQEDKRLQTIFGGILCGEGTYLEMGALDGLLYSNSFFFHNTYGWKGVLIEGAPNNYRKLEQNRPYEIATVHAAVCDSEQTVHFVDKEQIGGIWEFSSGEFRDRYWKGVSLDDVPEVKCSPLTNLLDHYSKGTTHFDFWSLDIEGGELTALKSIRFDTYTFGIILVENNPRNPPESAMRIRDLLGSKGYVFHSNWNGSDWFVNKHFYDIYGKHAFG